MSKLQKMIDYLGNLEQARAQAFAEGNWYRVDFLQNCIDDTRAEIERLSA